MKLVSSTTANIGLVAASILVSLMLVELIAGYIYDNLPARYDNGKRLVEIYIGKSPSIQGTIEPHPYLLYQNTPNYYADGFKQHNSLGYRSKEFDLKKKDSKIRILALGGSTTYMYPFVKNPNNTWVSQLEVMLKNKITQNIEIINGGLPYATTAELLSSYVFRHKYLKPDILIIHTGGNDVAPLLFEKYDPEYMHFRSAGSSSKPRKFESKILSTSNFFKLFYAIWLKKEESVYHSQPYSFKLVDRKKAIGMVENNESKGFRRNLDTLIKLAIEENVKVVLFAFLQAREKYLSKNRKDIEGLEKAFVLALNKHYRIMEELSEKYAIPFLKPNRSLFEDSWFIDNCHLNEKGEYMKANILYNYFVEKKDKYFAGIGK